MDINDYHNSDLYVYKYGIKNCKSRGSYSRTCHQEYILFFITEGKGIISLPPQNYSIYKDQVLLIYPDQGNYSITSDDISPLSYMWISFRGSRAFSLLEHTSFSSKEPVCSLHVPLDQMERIFQGLMMIHGDSLSEEIRKTGYLYRLLSFLTASYHVSQPKGNNHAYPSKTYAIYAREYIKNNYAHTSITDIAHYIGIDRSYLHHVFKDNFQVSPQEYLISCRLTEAQYLLKETTLSIQQIAHDVGYDDSLQFSKIFKKHYGCSPKYYRNTTLEDRSI